MKKIKITLTKIMFPILLAVICGVTFSKVISDIYTNNLNNIINSRKIYILSEKYQDFNEMNYHNQDYLYYQNNNEYKKVVGITKEIKNIEKIKQIYDTDINVDEYQINQESFLEELNKYDLQLLKETNSDKLEEIINHTLELYKNNQVNLIINS